MAISDPVADMLTQVRNANSRRAEHVEIPHSKLKEGITAVLKEEGFVRDFRVLDHPAHGDKIRRIRVYLKYGPDNEGVIREIKRTSKPGRRQFVPVDDIPKVLDGFGIAILSTSKGVLSSRRAKAERTGGEVLCTVW